MIYIYNYNLSHQDFHLDKKVLNMGKVAARGTKRLLLDYARLKSSPDPYIYAEPEPSNILKW